jgi:molecular chaperone DnaK
LANNTVRVFIEKGTPLPTKRTFTLHTLETAVMDGSPAAALRIPLVQGELDDAHLCRLVGTIDIMAADLDRALPAGTPVEVTLELDRGGQLTAQAYVPSLKRLFEQVAHLVVPDASPVALASTVGSLLERLATLKQQARERQWTWLLEKVEGLARDHQEAERAVDSSQGGDQEQGQRARRLVLDLDSRTAELEAECRWPEVTERAMDTYVWAVAWVAEHGSPTEQAMLTDAGTSMQRAITSRTVREVERHRRIISRLGHGCFLRSPDAYTNIFEDLASNTHRSRDLKRAEQLVAAGRAALALNDTTKLKGICDQLAELLPPSEVEQRRAFSSSLRG